MTRALALVAVIVLAGGCGAPVTELSASGADEPAVVAWVLDHGWHTAIAVRRADVDARLWPVVDDFPGATVLEVAWGDRDFYMADPATAAMAIRAAFGARKSVLHVVGLGLPLAARFPGSEIVELRLSRRGFDAMTRFLGDELRRDGDSRPIRIQRGLYGASWFYEARSAYHLLNTCNTWVARALRVAGLPVTPAGVITAGGVMQQVRAVAATAPPP